MVGCDGKAGMAAIANLQVDLKMLNSKMQDALPPYSRPIFIKLVESVNTTGEYYLTLHEDGLRGGWGGGVVTQYKAQTDHHMQTIKEYYYHR